MQYAFGDAIICDNLTLAKQICYERKEKVKGFSFSFFLFFENLNLNVYSLLNSRNFGWNCDS